MKHAERVKHAKYIHGQKTKYSNHVEKHKNSKISKYHKYQSMICLHFPRIYNIHFFVLHGYKQDSHGDGNCCCLRPQNHITYTCVIKIVYGGFSTDLGFPRCPDPQPLQTLKNIG